MQPVRYDCDCDTVIEMEEMGVGIEEILQYARAVFSRDEILSLIRGLEEITARQEITTQEEIPTQVEA